MLSSQSTALCLSCWDMCINGCQWSVHFQSVVDYISQRLCPCRVWSLLLVYVVMEGKGPHRTCPAAAKCPLQVSISLRVCTPPATEGLNAWMAVWVDGWRKGTHRADTTLIPVPFAIWDAVRHFKGESRGGVNPGAVESPPLHRAALHSPLFPRPWPPASSKRDQSAVCLWWMGPLWLTDHLTRDQEVEGSVTQGLLVFYAKHMC